MKKILLVMLALLVCFSIAGLTNSAIAQTKGEICDNGKDDDGDKLVDCDDPDCDCTPPPTNEICDNGKDDDGDKLVDCDDPDCDCTPEEGVPCSPGYWKNHLTEFNQYCQAAVNLDANDRFASCDDLLTALTCRGANDTCGRSAAAALLNRVSGCFE